MTTARTVIPQLSALCRLPCLLLAMVTVLAGAAVAEAEDHRVSVSQLRGTVLMVESTAVVAPSAALRARLRQQLSIDWQDRSLREVVQDLHGWTGINLVLDPALALSAPPVTLRVREMSAQRVLDWVALLTKAEVSLVDEVVWIGSEPYRGRNRGSRMRMYDITDLASPVPNFPGPELNLAATTGQGQGFDLFAPGPQAAGDSRGTAEAIAEMVRRILNP